MKDPNSCSYCEEFYKMALFKNLPLQLLNCPYCGNTINQSSLQFYYKKYEHEINQSMKKNINTELNLPTSPRGKDYNNTEYHNISTNTTKNLSVFEDRREENSYLRPRQSTNLESEENRREGKENNYLKPRQPIHLESEDREQYKSYNHRQKSKEDNEDDEYLKPRYSKKRVMDDVEELIHEEDLGSKGKDNKQFPIKSPHTKDIQEDDEQVVQEEEGNEEDYQENEHEEENYDEQEHEEEDQANNNKAPLLINIGDDNKGEGSLAEFFRLKKLGMVEKLKKRKEDRELKVNEVKEKPEKAAKPNRKKTKSIIKKEESKESTIAHSIREPSPELLHRLSLGERASLSKKEMKELNTRLVSNLADVKKQENDEKRKQESVKRMENSKNFSQKLKDDAIKSKKTSV